MYLLQVKYLIFMHLSYKIYTFRVKIMQIISNILHFNFYLYYIITAIY